MKNIKDILISHGFTFNKSFGQNFLSDSNLLLAIVSDAGVNKDCDVLEIGPGAGALTRALCQKANKVVSYEIDKNLLPVLDETLEDFSNYKIILQDIMKANMADIEKNFTSNYKVVANIPYYITSPIIFKFLENSTRVDSITMMVQKEVAQRIVASPNDEAYGALSVMSQFYADVSIKRIVSAKMFFPVPKVDSAIIHYQLKKLEYSKEFIEKYKKLVSASFSMRRKTLINNLTANFGANKQDVMQALDKLNLPQTIRAEKLTSKDFIKLANLI